MRASAPAFSVIVPAYNAARTLPATMASIAAQTFSDYEVIVVDDGSGDDTGEVAERLGQGEHWHVVQQANRGLPGARNAGIAVARGRWLAFLDSDDMWLPGYLRRMRELLEGADDAGLAYCDAWIYDERRRRVARRSAMGRYRPDDPPQEPRGFFLALLRANFVWVSASAPRAVVQELGGFDETLRAAEDWNLWLRIAASGRAAVGTTDRLGVYRHSAGQMHNDTQRMRIGLRDAVRGVLASAELDDDLRAAAVARLQEAERVLQANGSEPRLRRALRVAIGPTRGVKDFRLCAPAEVAQSFPELVGQRPRARSGSAS